MTLILGLETSGLTGSVALSRDETVLGMRRLDQPGRRHAQTLVSECRVLLEEQGLTPRDLGAVAATRGPGSFTGLRVGIVSAKTLAYALKIPLLLIDTFDLVAAQCPPEWSSMWIVDDAQRNELYIGHYVRDSANPCRLAAPRTILPIAAFLAARSTADYVIGPGVARIPTDWASVNVLRDDLINLPRAETVCRLAASKLAAGQTDDPWTASPFYVRLSAAEEKAAARR